jgi:hypothetical protein
LSLGWSVVAGYDDNGISAASDAKAARLDALLKDATRGHFDVAGVADDQSKAARLHPPISSSPT